MWQFPLVNRISRPDCQSVPTKNNLVCDLTFWVFVVSILTACIVSSPHFVFFKWFVVYAAGLRRLNYNNLFFFLFFPTVAPPVAISAQPLGILWLVNECRCLILSWFAFCEFLCCCLFSKWKKSFIRSGFHAKLTEHWRRMSSTGPSKAKSIKASGANSQCFEFPDFNR